jgi:hypothetical protein
MAQLVLECVCGDTTHTQLSFLAYCPFAGHNSRYLLLPYISLLHRPEATVLSQPIRVHLH